MGAERVWGTSEGQQVSGMGIYLSWMSDGGKGDFTRRVLL